MIRGLERRLHQLVHDVLGRGSVGIAHAEVDDVFAAVAGGHLHGIGNGEDIRREALNAAEFFHDDQYKGSGIRGQGSRTRAGRRERGTKGTREQALEPALVVEIWG